MATRGNDIADPPYLTADQLHVGAFVILDLPWFKHSFTLNSFKIRSAEQLSELRALRLPRYRYDPARSDLPPDAPDRAPGPSPIVPDQAASAIAIEPQPLVTDPAQAERQRRSAANQQRREHVEQVEKAFAKAATIMKNLNRNIHARPQETLLEMGALIGDMADAFLNCPDATLHVMGEKSGGEDIYFHNLNVTILAMMLAKELGFGPELACEMGVGAMLHDIGLFEIPDRISKKPASESTKAERNLRATHVDLGTKLGQRIGLTEQALAVVAQHHECVDGSGYPLGLKEAAMTPAARLVSLVNYYDNLCNPPDLARAMTPHEALSHMFAQCRSKFDARALQVLIRSLGVHPPGSVVQLSDQSLGVVTSVNPKKPLRPWVLVYDESVPKDEAVTLSLQDEPGLSILKAIRPSLLSPKVAAYLNPRKRVTYFFDAGRSEPAGASR